MTQMDEVIVPLEKLENDYVAPTEEGAIEELRTSLASFPGMKTLK